MAEGFIDDGAVFPVDPSVFHSRQVGSGKCHGFFADGNHSLVGLKPAKDRREITK
jgi:hypothetical protein